VRTVFYKVDKDRPDSRAFPIRALTVENLPPQQDWFNKIPLDGPDLEIKEGDYTVSIAFTDAAGNRWERDPLGTLNLQS
jgi:hypothetical protein